MYYSYQRKSTGWEFFVPARTLIGAKLLILIIIFSSNLSSSTYYLSHVKKARIHHIPARSSGHFDIKTLRLLPQCVYHRRKTPQSPRKPSMFLTASPLIREEGPTISHAEKPSACIASQLLRRPAKSTCKRLILMTPLCQHYLLKMSMVPGINELTDAEWKRGQVTPQPTVLYASPRLAC